MCRKSLEGVAVSNLKNFTASLLSQNVLVGHFGDFGEHKTCNHKLNASVNISSIDHLNALLSNVF